MRNVPPDPDESVNEHVEHFFCVNHPDHYLCHQVSFFSRLNECKVMHICNLLFVAKVKKGYLVSPLEVCHAFFYLI